MAPNLAWQTGVTVTQDVGGTATGYSLGYAADKIRRQVWRSSTTSTDQRIIVTLPSPQLVKAVVLIDALKHAGGTMDVAWANGGGYTSFGGVNFPTAGRTGVTALYDDVGVTALTLRITFGNTLTASGFVELGEVYISSYLEPSQNVAPGAAIRSKDPSVSRRTIGGQDHYWQRDKRHAFDVVYGPLETTDRDSIQAVFESVGSHEPVVYAVDHDIMDHLCFGRLPEEIAAEHIEDTDDLWRIDLTVEEAL